MRGVARVPAAAAVAAVAALLLAPAGPTAAQETVAVTNATVHTVSGPVLEGATVLIRDGVIAAVGADVEVPGGARVVDGTGRVVTPGLTDSYSQIGLVEIGLSARGTVDHSTSEDALQVVFNPLLGVNPENTLIPNNRIFGVTSAVLRPGGGHLFPGQGALIALAGGSVDEMTRRESVAVYARMGEGGAGEAGGSRAANYQMLHDALWDARARILRVDDDDGDGDDPRAEGDRSSLSNRQLDALGAVLRRELPLAVSADRASDIRLALRLRSEFDVPMVVIGAREGWRVADEIARAGVAVVVNPLVNLPGFEALQARYENAAILSEAGVEVVISSFSSHQVRNLTHAAGHAVAYGMDHAAVLEAVTLAPARVWGVDGRMGSVEVGKVADLVVWSGDPFEFSTTAEHVFIGGREVPRDSRQDRLYERYRTLEDPRLGG